MRRSFLLLMFVCGLASAQPIPTDDEAFTKIAAEHVAKELPAYDVAPSGPLTIEGKRADGESTGSLSLDRIHAFCVRNASQCAYALDQYGKAIAELVNDRNQPIAPEMVRLAVRPAAYADNLRKQIAGSGAALYAHAVAPGLVAIPVLDFSRSVRFVTDKDLVKLGLTEQQLFTLGESNLRAHSKPLSEVTPTPRGSSFGQITGEDYASSRILMHDDWKALSARLDGMLVVVMPAPDVLLYGDASNKTTVGALLAYATEVARKTTHPLPLVLLRWTDTGWDAVP